MLVNSSSNSSVTSNYGLYDEFTNIFQKIIGVLMWSIELGRIYIMTEISCLYQHLCSPCEVCLNADCNIYRYLQKNKLMNPGRIAFDPAFVHTDENLFKVSTRELED